MANSAKPEILAISFSEFTHLHPIALETIKDWQQYTSSVQGLELKCCYGQKFVCWRKTLWNVGFAFVGDGDWLTDITTTQHYILGEKFTDSWLFVGITV